MQVCTQSNMRTTTVAPAHGSPGAWLGRQHVELQHLLQQRGALKRSAVLRQCCVPGCVRGYQQRARPAGAGKQVHQGRRGHLQGLQGGTAGQGRAPGLAWKESRVKETGTEKLAKPLAAPQHRNSP